MDTDKQQLVATANEEGEVTVGIVLMRKPPDGNRRICLRLLCVLVTLLIVVPIAVVLRIQFSTSDVVDTSNLKYQIKFDSVTEHIIDDPTNRLTQYHVVAPEHEVWAVHDFDEGAHVIKVADIEGNTNCYVTSLDAVTDEEYGSPDMTYEMVTDVGVVSLEMATNAREEIISFEADLTPMTDVSMLGKTGQELCYGHATYQMWQYEISSNDFDTEFDPDLPVLRTYTISHRESAATRRKLTQPQASLVMIDSTGLRYRRQELDEKEGNEGTPDETLPAPITPTINNTPEDQQTPSMMESRVFKLWDYFSRRRPTRTRRESAKQVVRPEAIYIVHDKFRPRPRPQTVTPARRGRRELPNYVPSTADRTTDDEASRVADAMVSNYKTIDRFRRRRQRRSSSAASRVRRQSSNREWPRQEVRQWPQLHQSPPAETADEESGTSNRVAGNNYRAMSIFRRNRG